MKALALGLASLGLLASCGANLPSDGAPMASADCAQTAKNMANLVGQRTNQAYIYQSRHPNEFQNLALAVKVSEQHADKLSHRMPLLTVITDQTDQLKTTYQMLDAKIVALKCE